MLLFCYNLTFKSRMKVICSVCRENFSPLSDVYAIECGHLFHHHCINKWLESSLTCPYCRFKIIELPLRIELEIKSEDENELRERDSNHEDLINEYKTLRKEEKEFKVKYTQMKEAASTLREEVIEAEKAEKRLKFYIKTWENELENAEKGYNTRERLKRENETLETEIALLINLKKLIYGSDDDMHEILSGKPISSSTVEEFCKYVQAMRYKLKKNKRNYEMEHRNVICLAEQTELQLAEEIRRNKSKKTVSDKSVQTQETSVKKVKKRRNVQPIY